MDLVRRAVHQGKGGPPSGRSELKDEEKGFLQGLGGVSIRQKQDYFQRPSAPSIILDGTYF